LLPGEVELPFDGEPSAGGEPVGHVAAEEMGTEGSISGPEPARADVVADPEPV